MSQLKLGVLVSGGGSNLQSIIDHIEDGRLPAEVAVVISNEPDAGGLNRAQKHGIASEVINHRDYPSREAFEEKLIQVLESHGVELVVLAGFMRLLSSKIIDAFPHRIINIHPALLPSFPGTHVWQDQIDHGVKFAGCTVHFVDAGMDTGPIIIQAVVPVLDDDDADTLAQRILRQEHRIYPMAVKLFAEHRLEINGRQVKILPAEHDQDKSVLTNPMVNL
jgi:phosphoribosylglycinamide formyltransferase-1